MAKLVTLIGDTKVEKFIIFRYPLPHWANLLRSIWIEGREGEYSRIELA